MKKGKKEVNPIEDKAREIALEQEANKRAAATPLPGALSEAFLSDAIDCGGGLFVRRIVASDWVILQWLDSPMYRMTLEVQKDESIREDVKYTPDEGYEMIWQFTHTPQQNRDLKDLGRKAYTDVAIVIQDTFNATILSNAIKAIGKQIVASFETKVIFDTEESKKK